MKKLVRVLSVLTLTLCLGLALTACAKEEGKYVYEGTDDGVTINITAELKDGKYTTVVTVNGQEYQKVEGTYKIKGDKLTVTVDGESVEATIKAGKSITISMYGEEYTLTYQK